MAFVSVHYLNSLTKQELNCIIEKILKKDDNMWQTKIFKTKLAMEKFIEKNKSKIQYDIIFVNNGFGIEYRVLRKIY